MLHALRRRWDIDPATQASLPIDQAIALINIRRIEVVCLLAVGNDLIEIMLGLRVAGIVAGIPAAILVALLSRRAQYWGLRAQQTAVIAFFATALLVSIWASAELSTINGVLRTSYPLQLLSITMLFVLPQRTLAAILLGLFLAYAAILSALPISHAGKVAGIANAAVVSAISMVAGWLIHAARRGDFEQKAVIRRQNARLAAHNLELDQLMAITAHDLRSPLYGLRNLLDLSSKRGQADGSVPKGVIGEALASLDAMVALVTRLLDAHGAEHAPLTAMIREDVRMHLVAAARRMTPTAEASLVRIDLSLPAHPIMVVFDSGALNQILDNLTSNAVRFSSKGSGVGLSCRALDGQCLIEIADKGAGFDRQAEATMFRKYARAARDGKAGSGMGLFIAATLADRMGAALSFRHASPTGAIFTIALPIG